VRHEGAAGEVETWEVGGGGTTLPPNYSPVCLGGFPIGLLERRGELGEGGG
jgi:hypothetical protein